MSVTIFGFILLAAVVGLGWKNSRVIAAAVCAVMLGVIIAGNGGPLSDASRTAVAGLRTGLSGLAGALIGG